MNYRPQTQTTMERRGLCKHVTGEIRMGGQTRLTFCCRAFVGPPSRKYCDEHSKTVQYRGRS